MEENTYKDIVNAEMAMFYKAMDSARQVDGETISSYQSVTNEDPDKMDETQMLLRSPSEEYYEDFKVAWNETQEEHFGDDCTTYCTLNKNLDIPDKGKSFIFRTFIKTLHGILFTF